MPYRSDTGKPQKCQRFARVQSVSGGTGQCDRGEFNETAMESCRDRWVFEDSENTIGTEVILSVFSHNFLIKYFIHRILFSSDSCVRKINGNFRWWVRSTTWANSLAYRCPASSLISEQNK